MQVVVRLVAEYLENEPHFSLQKQTHKKLNLRLWNEHWGPGSARFSYRSIVLDNRNTWRTESPSIHQLWLLEGASDRDCSQGSIVRVLLDVDVSDVMNAMEVHR
jgi:hypothetical protein